MTTFQLFFLTELTSELASTSQNLGFIVFAMSRSQSGTLLEAALHQIVYTLPLIDIASARATLTLNPAAHGDEFPCLSARDRRTHRCRLLFIILSFAPLLNRCLL